MEIILEILGWLLQFILELALQVFMETIAALLGSALKAPLRRGRTVDPALLLSGYFLYGGIAGGISLWIFPSNFIHAGMLRLAALLLIPLASGLVMGAMGAWRASRGKEIIRLESFFYGAAFALAMSFVRYLWAR